jgi:chromatin segregation and condensation protein Rec8/ScpA/Scc1 (kleisin family)
MTTTTMTFDQVTKHQNSVEVCRLFLATLQLANQGNVKIDPSHGFTVTKVSKPRKIIEKYRAPSMISQHETMNEVI